jgi:hypothetical protein
MWGLGIDEQPVAVAATPIAAPMVNGRPLPVLVPQTQNPLQAFFRAQVPGTTASVQSFMIPMGVGAAVGATGAYVLDKSEKAGAVLGVLSVPAGAMILPRIAHSSGGSDSSWAGLGYLIAGAWLGVGLLSAAAGKFLGGNKWLWGGVGLAVPLVYLKGRQYLSAR